MQKIQLFMHVNEKMHQTVLAPKLPELSMYLKAKKKKNKKKYSDLLFIYVFLAGNKFRH